MDKKIEHAVKKHYAIKTARETKSIFNTDKPAPKKHPPKKHPPVHNRLNNIQSYIRDIFLKIKEYILYSKLERAERAKMVIIRGKSWELMSENDVHKTYTDLKQRIDASIHPRESPEILKSFANKILTADEHIIDGGTGEVMGTTYRIPDMINSSLAEYENAAIHAVIYPPDYLQSKLNKYYERVDVATRTTTVDDCIRAIQIDPDNPE